jgi:short-subunit dehydrogenase
MTPPVQTVLILGGTSDIGRAIARAYANKGCELILAGRNTEQLKKDAEDLRLRYRGQVDTVEWNVLSPGGGWEVFSGASIPDIVICVAGLLGDQPQQEQDSNAADIVMRTNYIGPALILGWFANGMEERGYGTIIAISSVAGDRGRAKNYIYGSAKAGFTAFLSGLRNRLAKKGVRIITVKPGFVNTSMTAGMILPKALTAEPQEVARAVFNAMARGKDVVYVRKIWRPIMIIICAIPERVFKKLDI